MKPAEQADKDATPGGKGGSHIGLGYASNAPADAAVQTQIRPVLVIAIKAAGLFIVVWSLWTAANPIFHAVGQMFAEQWNSYTLRDWFNSVVGEVVQELGGVLSGVLLILFGDRLGALLMPRR